MAKTKNVKLSDSTKWKNTPAGPALSTDINDSIATKILEKTTNEKVKEVLEKLRKTLTFLDDNILAH